MTFFAERGGRDDTCEASGAGMTTRDDLRCRDMMYITRGSIRLECVR